MARQPTGSKGIHSAKTTCREWGLESYNMNRII